MEMAVESGQPAGETCVETPYNLQGKPALTLFFKEDVESGQSDEETYFEDGLELPLIFKPVESGQLAGETCVGTPDDLEGFESLVAAALPPKKAARKAFFIDLPEVELLGFIPTNNTAPGPDPPVLSTLKSVRQLAEFADMIRVEFGTMADLPCGLTVEDFIGNTLFGQVYRGKIIQQRGLNNIKEANVLVKAWNYRLLEVRSHAKPDNRFWRQIAKGRFHDEMKLLKASSPLSRHDNMVKLIGSGLVNGRLAAVYELDPLDTLRNLLPRDDFGWFPRVKAAIQFASLIEAFHSQNLKLRNICADNLVLDKVFHVKLVDFGLLIGGDFGAIPLFEKVWGCYGYVDPCYSETGKFLDKSDVFSYGVLLLELVTKRAAPEEDFHLHVWARGEYETRPKKTQFRKECRRCPPVLEVHESLRGSVWFDAKDGAAIIELALCCVSRNPVERPTIKEVVERLRQLELAKRMNL
ncbi:probable serine/threonine-protein kinase PBL18 [Rhododendron vialii]|uniref:probable serine/threonine-protein kinase PBL18 n=1 Tax=Rhododendron vialii TaxID=182163 RepID=UPI00265E74D3|nr:probable serine/threonine-protein kinase PBL18 [Rhododendron vialii]